MFFSFLPLTDVVAVDPGAAAALLHHQLPRLFLHTPPARPRPAHIGNAY